LDDAAHGATGQGLVADERGAEALAGEQAGQEPHRRPAVSAIERPGRQREPVKADAVDRRARTLDLDRDPHVAEGLRRCEVVEATREVRDLGASLRERGEDERTMSDRLVARDASAAAQGAAT